MADELPGYDAWLTSGYEEEDEENDDELLEDELADREFERRREGY